VRPNFTNIAFFVPSVASFLLAFMTTAVASEGRETIAWRAWGDDAFAEARRADRPVLLLITDPGCDGCGEEEREATDDEDAAHLVNAGFVAIAVDRFDRPDLAGLYSSALDAPPPGRGRTLVVFLLPDGRPFAAQWGLSRTDRGTSPGLRTLALRRLSDFRQDRPGVEAAAARNLDRLRRAQRPEPPRGPLGGDVVEAALRGLTESFDPDSGGFGPGGEVPIGSPRFLLEENARRPNPAAVRMASAALDRLGAGQGATGVLWHDAVVLRGMAQSYAASGSPAHRAAAEALAVRVVAQMREAKGGFLSLRPSGAATADDRVIAGWNGLMIGALATSGSVLDRASDVQAAVEAAGRVRERLGPASGLRHSARGETAGGPAFLDDYAYLADGLLDLHAATGDARWLTEAVALVEAAVGRFLDPVEGGFFTTEAAAAPLPVRPKQAFDAPLPSANGVMARVLLRLDRATGERRYGELARATVDAFRGDLQRAPRGMETLAGAAAEILAAGAGATLDATPRPARQVVGPVTVEASLSSARVAAGALFDARVRLSIAEGWRIVAREPGVKDLLGLTISVVGEGLTSVGPRYPEPRQEKGPWNTGAVSVYAGEATVTVPVRIDRRAPAGDRRVGLRVVFQACDTAGCKPPQTAHLEVPVTIEPEG
jgi:uncharacterized protein YyaL (SSP411 family)